MRRINIVIDPELDDRLEQEAALRRSSKSAIVRDRVRRELGAASGSDTLARLIGIDDGDPVDDVDEVVYG
jgi:predicted transcriptional regulator